MDFVATITELTAVSIARAYKQFAPAPIAQVVIGGGGVHNPHLLARLAFHLQQQWGHPIDLCTHAALGIEAEAKEALAFALLAYLTIHGWPGNVPVCTGAASQQILGQIAPGNNYTALLRQSFFNSYTDAPPGPSQEGTLFTRVTSYPYAAREYIRTKAITRDHPVT